MQVHLFAYLLILILSSLAEAETFDCQKYDKYKCENNNTFPVHLTFDDGPAGSNTEQILDVLEKYRIRATFFVVGENLINCSNTETFALLARMRAEGHLIGSHSFKHELHTALSDKTIREYVRKAKQAGQNCTIQGKEVGKYLSPVFRLPYGDGWFNAKKHPGKSKRIMKILDDEGFTHVGWDVVAWDWDIPRQKNPGILDIILRKICETGGGIVLLHDIQPHTAQNLDEWIQAIKCVGHSFVGLDTFVKMENKTNCETCDNIPQKRPSLENFVTETISTVKGTTSP